MKEDDQWRVPEKEEISLTIREARDRDVEARCIVIINPSNPTGAVSSQDDLEALVELAAEEKLLLLADEVYQENIFPGNEFVSCKKIIRRLQEQRAANDPRYTTLQLISPHFVSKAWSAREVSGVATLRP